jgi:stringent starvation protein B
MHEWMVDNGLTPHIVVDAARHDVKIPEVKPADGKIVFNVSHSATRALELGNDVIAFEARFGGVPRHLAIPVTAVLGIYARETGQGMLFGDEDGAAPPDPNAPPPDPAAPADGPARRPTLKVVK